MNIITSKGRVWQIKAMFPFEEVEYEVGDEKKRDYSQADLGRANGLLFRLDTNNMWESQVFIVGNLPNDILQEIAKTVANGKVYDFTEFKYQDAKETCDVSLKSVKPWSSEHTFVPLNVQEKLNRASSPVLMIPTCFSGVQQCFEPMGAIEEVDEDAEE